MSLLELVQDQELSRQEKDRMCPNIVNLANEETTVYRRTKTHGNSQYMGRLRNLGQDSRHLLLAWCFGFFRLPRLDQTPISFCTDLDEAAVIVCVVSISSMFSGDMVRSSRCSPFSFSDIEEGLGE